MSGSLVRTDGDPVVISCVKMAETGKAVIVRLLEMTGKRNTCTLCLNTPDALKPQQVFYADVVERPGRELSVTNGAVNIDLGPNAIATIRFKLGEK